MIQTRSRWWRMVAAIAALLMIVAACGDDDGTAGTTTTTPGDTSDTTDPDDGNGTDDEEPQYGGRIVIGLEAEAGGYTPGLTATGTSSVSVDNAIYDALVVINGEGDFEPYLAESIESNDDLTEWTITLRSGVQFHDGTPLDAEAIVWNFENLHQAEGSLTTGAISTAGLDEVEAVDELTVVYRLRAPNAAFLDLLTGRVGMPASPTAFESMGVDDFGQAPVGTGPFVVDRWTPDSEIVLTRNDNYWQSDADGNPLPYLDEVVFRPLPDEDSRFQSLMAGDVHIIQTTRGYNGKQIVEAADGDGFDANPVMGNIAGASIFNILQPPLDDIRVRTALVMATSADDIAVAQGYDGITSAASQFVSQDSPWFSTEAESAYVGSAGQDLDGARALLQEYIDDPDRSDGQAPGSRISFRYQCPPEPSLLDMAQVLQGVWGDIGADVQLVQVEQPTLISNVIGNADQTPAFRGDFDVSCWRVGTNDDPLQYVANYFGPVETTVTNFVNYTNDEITEQLEILRSSPDFGERYAALERINVIANTDVVTAWHISYVSTVGWTDDLRGVDTWYTPSGALGRGNLAGAIRVMSVWRAE